MPDDFVTPFLSSGGNRVYQAVSPLYPGASWVPSPLTDPATGTDLAAWWKSSHDAVVNSLDKSKTGGLTGPGSPGEVIAQQLPSIVDPAHNQPPTRGSLADRCAVVATMLSKIQQGLKVVLEATNRPPDGLGAALADFRNRSLTVGMGVTTLLESSTKGTSMNDTFNELFLRDRSAALYELVGDPPSDALFGKQDTVADYSALASGGLRFQVGATDGGGSGSDTYTMPSGDARTLFTSGVSRLVDQGQRSAAFLQLAVLAQALVNDATRLAASGDPKATDAVAMSGVVAQCMRGVFGLTPKGDGKVSKAPDREEMDSWGEVQSARIEADVKGRESTDPTDPGAYGDGA
jgi:hypothetical protein